MYSFRQLRLALSRPKLVLREINRWYFRLTRGEFNSHGVDVFEEDWDNLIILDTARYDVMAARYEEYELFGDLEWRISRGSATHQFLKSNVNGKQLHDVVYVTASPHLYKHDDIDHDFYDVKYVWLEDGEDEIRAKPPGVTTKYAKQFAEKYPDKRLIIHYVQPHWPFLGPTGQKFFEGVNSPPWLGHIGKGKGVKFTDGDVWQMYLENLDLVIPHVKDLMHELQGRTVVTADHGQLIGEKQAPIPIHDHGHPPGIYVDELVKVPWLEYDNGERKQTKSEPPVYEGTEDVGTDTAAKQALRELGYITD